MQSMALIGKSLPSLSFTLVSLLPSVTNDTVNKAKLCCRTETVRSTLGGIKTDQLCTACSVCTRLASRRDELNQQQTTCYSWARMADRCC